MRFSKRFGVVLGAALALACPVAVMPAAMVSVAEAKTPPLTAARVEKFCDSFPEVKKIALAQGKKKGKDVSGASDQFAAVIAAATDDSAAREVDAAVRAHGFSGFKEWMNVGRSIVSAYAHIKTGGGQSKAQKKLEKTIRKIEKNDFLSEKQKAKLIEGLRKGAEDVLEEPPAEDLAAVRPMVGKIEAVMQ